MNRAMLLMIFVATMVASPAATAQPASNAGPDLFTPSAGLLPGPEDAVRIAVGEDGPPMRFDLHAGLSFGGGPTRTPQMTPATHELAGVSAMAGFHHRHIGAELEVTFMFGRTVNALKALNPFGEDTVTFIPHPVLSISTPLKWFFSPEATTVDGFVFAAPAAEKSTFIDEEAADTSGWGAGFRTGIGGFFRASWLIEQLYGLRLYYRTTPVISVRTYERSRSHTLMLDITLQYGVNLGSAGSLWDRLTR